MFRLYRTTLVFSRTSPSTKTLTTKRTQVDLVNNKIVYKICLETICIAFAFALSIFGIHYLIINVLNFSSQDSIIILLPVFLISFPAIVYGYQTGLKRYYNNKIHMNIQGRIIEYSWLLTPLLLITFVFLVGLYYIIINKYYYLGVGVTLFGAIISIPISNKIYITFIQKDK
jgi:hypothetical protein